MSQLVIFDFETTSATPATARVVQLAALQLDLTVENPEAHELINTLCNPGVEIHHEAAAVHGISDEMVKDAEPDEDVCISFVSYLDEVEGLMLATHNGTTFDIPILERLGFGKKGVLKGIPHIDTLILAQRLWPLAPTHKLSNDDPTAPGLIQFLKIGSGAGAHDALADIRMVWDLIKHSAAYRGCSVEDLAAWCAEPYVHDICHFGKHKGKPYGKGKGCVPWFYVNWCAENWDSASIDQQATLLHHYGIRFKFPGALRSL